MTDKTKEYEVAYDCWSRMFDYDDYANYINQIEGVSKLPEAEYRRLYRIWSDQYEERIKLWYD